MRPLAAVLLALAPAALAAPAADRFPDAATAYLVAVNGRILWARKPDAPLPPASLTKIMMGLVVLERGVPREEWVRVSGKAAQATGTRLGLRAGDEIRAGDALVASLVSSSNDACLALAEHVAGSGSAFAALMNRRASELGLEGTHFANPCGHDAPGHQSTARSLWRLTQAALGSPEFRRIVALERAEVRTRDGRTLSVVTGNALLGRARGATGVKSGFTPAAGKCLVARAQRGDTDVVVVMLGAPDRWWTAARILEAAFDEAAAGG